MSRFRVEFYDSLNKRYKEMIIEACNIEQARDMVNTAMIGSRFKPRAIVRIVPPAQERNVHETLH